MQRSCAWWKSWLASAAWLAWLAAATSALAQSASTAATTLRDAEGRSWAFLAWNTDETNFVRRAVVAVYRKAGLPSAPSDYELVSVVRRNDDATFIRAALQQSQHLGQDLAALDALVQSSFSELAPSATLPLEEKLRIVIAAARSDENMDHVLQFLARSQPGIAAAAGQAYICEIPTDSPTTFELRLCDHMPSDPGTECRTVLALVTLTGGVFSPLPAPGAPMDVSWRGPRGDLNVRLIWATPDPLRAESLLQAGFQAYRVTPAYFAANYATHPPGPDDLARASQTDPAAVRRVNVKPVYPDELLSQTQVDYYRAQRGFHATADPDGRNDQRGDDGIPFFVADDNRGLDQSGTPFNDGDQFYYYVVARDLLGREGIASPETLITLCTRRAPVTPLEVEVEVASISSATPGSIGSPVTEAIRDQFFKIRWHRNPTNSAAVPTDAYRIYRWDSPDQTTKPGARGAEELKEIPAGDRRTLTYETVDDSPPPGRPTLPRDDQRTFWYTVRAVRRAPCGDELLSDHSAPAFGVLRSWVGPPRASGDITVFCAQPQVQFISWTTQAVAIPSPNIQEMVLVCDRTNRSAIWAEYYLAAVNQPDPTGAGLAGDRFLGRVWFRDGETRATLNTQIPRTTATAVRVRCRVGSAHGAISPVVDGVFTPANPKAWSKVRGNFRSLYVPGQRTLLADCGHHATRHPETGRLEPIGVTMHYTGSTREHRVYVSIDDGPLDLVARGSGPLLATPEEWFTGFPANAAKLCFYVEYLDSQGLAGPKSLLDCVEAPGQQDLPVPMLAKPEGTTASGGTLTVAALKWFCAPYAVDRFRVLVGVTNLGFLLPSQISSALYASPATQVETVAGKTYRVYETGKVGGNFSQVGQSNFTATVDVRPNVNYTFLVQAVSAAGTVSAFSQPAEFQWSAKSPPGDPSIAWPARALPVIQAAAAGGRPSVEGAAARPTSAPQLFDPDAWTDDAGKLHLGVLIGETTGALVTDPQSGLPTLDGVLNANDLLGFLQETDIALRPEVLPCVLYRYQVANPAFPQVSGDVIQVSPLMQGIAHRTTGTPGAYKTLFVDPFVDLRAVMTSAGTVIRIYLKDTQPAVQEAAYRYLLVKFSRLGEIESVHHTPAVTIP